MINNRQTLREIDKTLDEVFQSIVHLMESGQIEYELFAVIATHVSMASDLAYKAANNGGKFVMPEER